MWFTLSDFIKENENLKKQNQILEEKVLELQRQVWRLEGALDYEKGEFNELLKNRLDIEMKDLD